MLNEFHSDSWQSAEIMALSCLTKWMLCLERNWKAGMWLGSVRAESLRRGSGWFLEGPSVAGPEDPESGIQPQLILEELLLCGLPMEPGHVRPPLAFVSAHLCVKLWNIPRLWKMAVPQGSSTTRPPRGPQLTMPKNEGRQSVGNVYCGE